MNYKNRQQLEEYFAENFHSSLFPILSEHYLLDGDLDRAERVCDIGLKLNKSSIIGLFLKARILMAKKDFIAVEQYLKKIISSDPGFLNALVLMLEVQSKLKQPKLIQKKYCEDILALDPSNLQAEKKLKELHKIHGTKKVITRKKLKHSSLDKRNKQNKKNSLVNKSQNKKSVKRSKSSAVKNANPKIAKEKVKSSLQKNLGHSTFEISPNLATFTLVKVLRSQKLYDRALEVLSVMSRKDGVNKKKISQQKKSILSLIAKEGSM